MSTELTVFSTQEISTMANAVAKSHMFPGIDTLEQAFTLMMLSQSQNLHPMTVLTRYTIIDGKPSWKSEALLAAFKEKGGKVTWEERNNKVVRATFQKDDEKITIEWTIEMAIDIGLTTKKNWKYPRHMLSARAISEGVGLIAPGIRGGFYTAEEMQDLEPEDDPGREKVKQARRKVKELAPDKLEPAQIDSEVSTGDLLTDILEEIDAAKEIKELTEIVTITRKLEIAAMPQADKSKCEEAYRSKQKLLMFSNVPGTIVTEESSTQTLSAECVKINACKTVSSLVEYGDAVTDTTRSKLLPADQEGLKTAYSVRMRELQDEKPVAEEQPTIDVSAVFNNLLDLITKTDSIAALNLCQEQFNQVKKDLPEGNVQWIEDSISDKRKLLLENKEPANPIYTEENLKNIAAGFELDVQKAATVEELDLCSGRLKAMISKLTTKDSHNIATMISSKRAILTAPVPNTPAEVDDGEAWRVNAAQHLEIINEIKTRAQADVAAKNLEDGKANLFPEDYNSLKAKIEHIRASLNLSLPKSAPAKKQLEQLPLPGLVQEKAESVKLVYGENDTLPEWIKMDVWVEVSANPNGKPYLTSRIVSEPFLEKTTRQMCVKVLNVQYPVPVSCIKEKKAE